MNGRLFVETDADVPRIARAWVMMLHGRVMDHEQP
jgi:hypothetical protein